MLWAQGAFLTDGRVSRYVVNPYLVALLPHLQEGTASADELALQLRTRQAPSVTFWTLDYLRRGDWLEQIEFPGSRELGAGWSGVATRSPQRQTVSLQVVPQAALHRFSFWKSFLVSHDWLSPVDAEGEIELVVCCDFRHSHLMEYARNRGEKPWLPLRIGGGEVWAGPLLGTAGAPPWARILQAVERNQPGGGWLAGRLLSDSPFEECIDWSASTLFLALSLAIKELERALCRPDPTFGVFDLHEGVMTRHQLGPWLPRERSPLSDIPKPNPRADRLLDEEQAWNLLRSLVDPRLGIVTRTFEVEPARIPWPAFIAQSIPPGNPRFDLADQTQTSVGRARRGSSALLGAVAEAVERYCGLYQDSDGYIQASWNGLDRPAIHPDNCLHFSQAQYAGRTENPGLGFNVVSTPFDPDSEIGWSRAYSLTSKAEKWLPSSLLYFSQGELFDDPGAAFCRADSNGCASGGCLEEAVFHGLLELIERDAVAIWWYNRLSRPALELSRFGSQVAALATHFEASGEKVWALDLTHDLGVPVVAVVSVRAEGREEPALGFSCHPDPEKAIYGALQEAIQWSCAYGNRTRNARGDWESFRLADEPASDPEAFQWITQHSTLTDPYLLPSSQTAELPKWAPAATFLGEIERIRLRLESKGLEVLIVDQSRSECPLATARVIVPGLRKFWRRLAPGRLYDVPVSLGWLERPHTEEELNPVSLFL